MESTMIVMVSAMKVSQISFLLTKMEMVLDLSRR